VASDWAGKRLDAVAASVFSQFSRNRLQSWIIDGHLTVDGQRRKVRDKMTGGEQLCLQLPARELAEYSALVQADGFEQSLVPEPMDLNIVHEDEHILIINKPAGLVMHPAPGNRHGTLLNGLLHHQADLLNVPRAGIVHRLDKDTTGLCVVAKTLEAHTHLVRQLQAREMGRRYIAVVIGSVPINGRIDAPIGRHPGDRKKMAVSDKGKEAVTHYQCTERYNGCAQIQVTLETGRTHQIRVHMTHIGHALIGDQVYGRRLAVLPRQVAEVPEVAVFTRQALHATQLSLIHPATEAPLTVDAALPEDMQRLCGALKRISDQLAKPSQD